MKRIVQASIAAALSLAALPAVAADLGNGHWGRGSIKDDHAAAPSQASTCYYRADVGTSFSNNPNLRWTADDGLGAAGAGLQERVTNTSMANTWTGGVGVGCGSGSRGFRYEAMLGYHGQRGINGTTSPFDDDGGAPLGGPNVAEPHKIHSAVTSYTGMVNGYFDLGNMRGFVPYVGAGVGLAYHQMDDYTYSVGGARPYRVTGDNDLTLAWSVMAGVGYQVSDRAILDIGYRYLDLGRAATGRADPNSFTPSKLSVDDMTAHEFKIGLRYHMGGNCCGAAQYAPMK